MKNCLLHNNLSKWNDSDARHRLATCDSGRVTANPDVTLKTRCMSGLATNNSTGTRELNECFALLPQLRVEVAKKKGGLNGSMQHWLGVY